MLSGRSYANELTNGRTSQSALSVMTRSMIGDMGRGMTAPRGGVMYGHSRVRPNLISVPEELTALRRAVRHRSTEIPEITYAAINAHGLSVTTQALEGLRIPDTLTAKTLSSTIAGSFIRDNTDGQQLADTVIARILSAMDDLFSVSEDVEEFRRQVLQAVMFTHSAALVLKDERVKPYSQMREACEAQVTSTVIRYMSHCLAKPRHKAKVVAFSGNRLFANQLRTAQLSALSRIVYDNAHQSREQLHEAVTEYLNTMV
jgi:hypothetical protein